MRTFLVKQLARKARSVLAEGSPIVIGVTGSVGKTSTTHAIAALLSTKYRVVSPQGNYNNEFGLPLSILQQSSPGRSVFGWLKLLLSRPPKAADVYVLEYGVDHPGDMDYLLSVVKPSMAVMTALSPVHEEFFTSLEAIGEEKVKLLQALPADGAAFINGDDDGVLAAATTVSVPVYTYGWRDAVDVHAANYAIQTRSDFSFEPGEEFSMLSFAVEMDGQSIRLSLPNQLGKHTAHVLLPAVAIALRLGVSPEDIQRAAQSLPTQPGRMNPIPGIKGSLIIDSSYNAAPASMTAALAVLAEFEPVEPARRIAVLGYMAELGAKSEQEHRLIGMRAAEVCDRLVTVGEMAHHIRHAAIEAGMSEEDTEEFMDSTEAGRWLDREIKKGDIVLVKGSQSARMERVVKDVMAEPLRASELLVRQTGKWVE